MLLYLFQLLIFMLITLLNFLTATPLHMAFTLACPYTIQITYAKVDQQFHSFIPFAGSSFVISLCLQLKSLSRGVKTLLQIILFSNLPLNSFL